MKKTLVSASGAGVLFIGFLLFAVSVRPSGASVPVSHDLRVSLDPESQRLTGIDTLRFEARGTTELFLNLASDAQIVSVSMAGEPVPFTFAGGRLRILPPDRTHRGEIEISVSYEGFFRDKVPVNPLQTEDPGYGVTGVISPEGAFLLSGARWYPDLPGSKFGHLTRRGSFG